MTWLIVFFAVVVALVGVVAFALARGASASLRRRFGPEYDRVVEQTGSRRDAEAMLRDRVWQRDALELRELTPEAHDRYGEEWQEIQGRFVDDPRQTLDEAAEIVTRLINERGYPVDETDDYSNYVSVDYPDLAPRYAAAQAVRIGVETATIDDQRQAIQNYRSLFDELLMSRADPAGDAAESGAERAEHDVS